jgi:hypothetical protein
LASSIRPGFEIAETTFLLETRPKTFSNLSIQNTVRTTSRIDYDGSVMQHRTFYLQFKFLDIVLLETFLVSLDIWCSIPPAGNRSKMGSVQIQVGKDLGTTLIDNVKSRVGLAKLRRFIFSA